MFLERGVSAKTRGETSAAPEREDETRRQGKGTFVDSGSTERCAEVRKTKYAGREREELGAHTGFAVIVLMPSSREDALDTWYLRCRGIKGAVLTVRDVVVQEKG